MHARVKGSCGRKRSVEEGEDRKERDGRRARVGRVPVATGDSVSATLLPFNPSYSFSMNERLSEDNIFARSLNTLTKIFIIFM